MAVSMTAVPKRDVLRGKSVLVVEDDEDTRELVVAILSGAGATVVAASSVAGALAIFKAATFDVLVSDIGMPQQDGYDLVREVRAMPPSRNGGVPAVALTAFDREADRRRAYDAGFQVHLAKPCEPNRLVEVVRGLADGSVPAR